MAHPSTPSTAEITKNAPPFEQVYQFDLPTPPFTPQVDKNALVSLPAPVSPTSGTGRGRNAVFKVTDAANVNGASSRSYYKPPTFISAIGPEITARRQRLEAEDHGLCIENMSFKAAGPTSTPPVTNNSEISEHSSSSLRNNKAKAKTYAEKARKNVLAPISPVTISKAFVTTLSNTKVSTRFPKITGDFQLIESRYRVDNRKWNRDRAVNVLKDHVPRKINLVGTVKLHGQHADIVVNQDNTIRLQSRNMLCLDREEDIFGFAATMFSLEKNVLELKRRIESRWIEINPRSSLYKNYPLVISGEWVGPGVQKDVALDQLPRRLFVITSISLDNKWLDDQPYADIEDEDAGIVHVARGGFFEEELDVTDLESCQERTMALTLGIADTCPFAQSFGITGRGEGVVWKAAHPLGKDSRFWIKTKGPDFAVTKTSDLPSSKVTSMDENKVERTRQFAFATTTQPRLAQGWDVLFIEQMLPINARARKQFIDWVARDILDEEMIKIKECKVDEQYLIKCIHWMAEIWYETRLAEIEKPRTASSPVETQKVGSTALCIIDETVYLQPGKRDMEVPASESGSSWW
ncbi:hypothetical protein WAI453_010126 [Rhynchosporium graminicola]